MKILEKEVMRDVKQFLDIHGLFWFRTNNGGVYNAKSGGYFFQGTKGVPDLFLLKSGFPVVGIECKSSTGIVNLAQKSFHKRFVEEGGVILVVRSSIELEEDLREIGIISSN